MTLFYTSDEARNFKKSLMAVHFHSNFGWVNSHNGFRRGSMHLLIAGTGAGKSTITRSIIRDLIFHKDNDCIVGVWLSEETIEEYKTLFSLGVSSNDKLLNTNAISEMDNSEINELYFFEWLGMIQPDILILDNITTSKFYVDKKPDEQARFATKLKEALKKNNCAGVIIAHADSQQTAQRGGLLDINNIRGSKTICNLTEFAYILQTFSTPLARFTALRIVKSRSQKLVHDLYYLKYEPSSMSYVSDTASEFKEFKEAFNARNKF